MRLKPISWLSPSAFAVLSEYEFGHVEKLTTKSHDLTRYYWKVDKAGVFFHWTFFSLDITVFYAHMS